MLELLRELLGEDTAQDTILNMYIDLAKNSVIKYINKPIWTDEDINTYTYQIILYAKYLYNTKDEIGLVSESEGKRSVTYNTSNIGIPEEIKALLPVPYIKIVG